jgi:hypothetical protein
MFVAKYNTSGVIQWQRRLGGTGTDFSLGIDVDGSGNVYIAGYEPSQTAGNNDIFIAKYNTSGVIQWQRRLGGTAIDQGAGIAVDGSGNAYITGYEASQTAGTTDMFVAKYNTSGVIQWQRRLYSSTHELYGTSIVVNGTTFSVCGYYQSSSSASVNSFSASLPTDGTKTGSSVTFSQVYATPVVQYAATTLTDAATTLTDAATTLTDAATTLTDAATTLTDAATTYTAETHTI